MSNCQTFNCATVWDSPPQLIPNPDISGVGVLVGFFATAYIIIFLLGVHYVLVFDPADVGARDKTSHANPVDTLILNFFARRINRPLKTWKSTSEKLVLLMSDQQMITGIALLSSAYSQLQCGISAYHWQITIYLVWFSSFTHLATLTFLRGYFQENSLMRSWRLFFMSALIVMLVVALIPTGNDYWLPLSSSEYVGLPTICFFNIQVVSSMRTSPQVYSMAFSVVLLFISYTSRAIKLFTASSRFAKLYLRTKPGNFMKGYLGKLYRGMQNTTAQRWIISMPYWFTLSVFLAARSWTDLIESMFWEIMWLQIALIWGSVRLFQTRGTAISDQVPNISEENSWGFGQCLSTAMLALVVFTALESYAETRKEASEEEEDTTTSTEAVCINIISPSPRSNSHTGIFPSGSSAEPKSMYGAANISMHSIGESIGGPSTAHELGYLQRPSTVPTREEQTTDATTERHSARQECSDEIEAELEIHLPPPHERDYYLHQWYFVLFLLNLYQILLFAAGLLAGASTTNAYANGIFGNLEDFGYLLRNILSWLTVYGPLTSVLFVLLNLFHPKMLLPLRVQDRKWLARRIILTGWDVTVPLVLVFFSTNTLVDAPIQLFWTSWFPLGEYFLIYAIPMFILVAGPWSWLVHWKLKTKITLPSAN